MSFRKLGAVILLVSDMDKSVQFYKETLNIPIKRKIRPMDRIFQ